MTMPDIVGGVPESLIVDYTDSGSPGAPEGKDVHRSSQNLAGGCQYGKDEVNGQGRDLSRGRHSGDHRQPTVGNIGCRRNRPSP